ncbi:MAG: hypothetical protein V1822_04535 [Candidatus Micrarchaeota archaeon]
MPKRKKMKVSDELVMHSCCEPHDEHSYERGKSLVKIATGLMLVSFGFGYINMQLLALVLGALFCLVGVVRMMSKNC